MTKTLTTMKHMYEEYWPKRNVLWCLPFPQSTYYHTNVCIITNTALKISYYEKWWSETIQIKKNGPPYMWSTFVDRCSPTFSAWHIFLWKPQICAPLFTNRAVPPIFVLGDRKSAQNKRSARMTNLRVTQPNLKLTIIRQYTVWNAV